MKTLALSGWYLNQSWSKIQVDFCIAYWIVEWDFFPSPFSPTFLTSFLPSSPLPPFLHFFLQLNVLFCGNYRFTCSCNKLHREVHFILCPVSPSGSILWNYITVSQARYWHCYTSRYRTQKLDFCPIHRNLSCYHL